MDTYKELYLSLFGACEDAINAFIAAQQSCEEIIISAPNPVIKISGVRP